MNRRRGGKRKVTHEAANFIRTKHVEGLAQEEIKRIVTEKYGIELHAVTVTRYYKPWDEVIEKYKEIARKQRKDRYDTTYHRYYRHLDEYLSELFSIADTLSLEEISAGLKKITGIEFRKDTIKKKINYYQGLGKGPKIQKMESKVYKINLTKGK